MKLYLLTQTAVTGFDVYRKAVVVARNDQEARETHPNGDVYFNYERDAWVYSDGVVYQDSHDPDWMDWPAHPEDVKATLLGDYINTDAFDDPVICESFHVMHGEW